MFNLFNTDKNRKLNKMPLYPNPNLDKIIFSQIILYKKFMLEQDFYISNNHPLVTLLSSCFTQGFMDLIPDEIAYLVKGTTDSVGNTMGLTTDRNIGRYFKDGNLEYLIFLENDFEVKDDGDYEVIKCVYTDYKILDFSYNTTVEEFMVIRIKPVELVLDYVNWRRDRELNGRNTYYGIYVATKLLPKLWDTKIGHVLFNRFISIYYKEDLPKYKNRHSIQLINRDDLMNADARRFLNFIKGNMKTDIYTLMYGFKYVGKDMLEVLSYDEKIFLNRNIFLLFLTRVKHVSFFLDLIKDTKSEAINISYVSELYIHFRRYRNGLVTLPELPNRIKNEYIFYLEKIKKDINYR